MPDNIKGDLCNQTLLGQMLFDAFVEERIQSGKVNIHLEHLVYNEETNALYVEEQREDGAVEIQVYSPDTDLISIPGQSRTS